MYKSNPNFFLTSAVLPGIPPPPMTAAPAQLLRAARYTWHHQKKFHNVNV